MTNPCPFCDVWRWGKIWGNMEIRDLYPNLSEKELKEAEENLDAYIKVAWRIYERIRQDPKEWARFLALTEERKNSRMNSKNNNRHDSTL